MWCCRAARHKYGLLEKKKDYLERARNHQKQESVLQVWACAATLLA